MGEGSEAGSAGRQVAMERAMSSGEANLMQRGRGAGSGCRGGNGGGHRRGVKKVDPSDGTTLTLEELDERYRGNWTVFQIWFYWNERCLPIPVDAQGLYRYYRARSPLPGQHQEQDVLFMQNQLWRGAQ